MKKLGIVVGLVLMVVLAGCKSDSQMVNESVVESGAVPEDFKLILDVVSSQYPENHIYMEINADGGLKFARYDNGGTNEFGADGFILVPGEDALERGLLNLNVTQMKALWAYIQDEGLFDLHDDYSMETGSSYAFIAVVGDSKANLIDNIGMELPQAEGLVNLVNSFLPEVVRGQYSQ